MCSLVKCLYSYDILKTSLYIHNNTVRLSHNIELASQKGWALTDTTGGRAPITKDDLLLSGSIADIAIITFYDALLLPKFFAPV